MHAAEDGRLGKNAAILEKTSKKAAGRAAMGPETKFYVPAIRSALAALDTIIQAARLHSHTGTHTYLLSLNQGLEMRSQSELHHLAIPCRLRSCFGGYSHSEHRQGTYEPSKA